MLDIVSASAGSGKTFRLAQEYIKLLFSRKGAYRSILAVTFTNKATEEMKERILQHLYTLATDPSSSPYLKSVLETAGDSALFGADRSVEKVSQVAWSVLREILNDYSAFSVSTIDRFFQRTMRAFARELGIYNTYSVELDRQSVYEEGIDAMIDSLDEEKDGSLLDWLTDMSVSSLSEGNNWNIRDELKKFGVSVFSEEFRIKSAGVPVAQMLSMDRIDTVRRRCAEVVSSYRKEFRGLGVEAMDIITSAGLSTEDFVKKSKSPFCQLAKVADGSVTEIKATLVSMAGAGADAWVASSAPASLKDSVANIYDELDGVLSELVEIQQTKGRIYNTALQVRKVISTLGVMSDIAFHTSRILKERNMVMLDDTNETLSRIIADDDCPFVYEKLGTRYENYMLDEFQDTSRLQWSNFRPLVRESLASDSYCLIVGDVKQSIYRWRSGDWTILGRDLYSEFGGMIRTESLDTNWRSLENLVNFNNSFFIYLAGSSGCRAAAEVYGDVSQKVSESKDGGYIRISFGDKNDAEGYDICEMTSAAIEDIISRGAEYGDIAVLVRSNAEGARIVSHLIEKGIPVVSEDSLFLASSEAVASIVKELRTHAVAESGQSLYALCEKIADSLPQALKESDTPYIYAMLDKVNDYMSQNGSDIYRFLTWWDNAGGKFTIPPPDGSSSVQVMTIHKSKGLAFKSVIIPFFEIPMYKETKVWCSLPEELYDSGMDGYGMIVPVTLSSSSEDTAFGDDYTREREQACVDNINVAYVAFTRAEKEMHIICKPFSGKFLQDADKGRAVPKSVSEHLYLYCCSKLDADSDTCYTVGGPHTYSAEIGKKDGCGDNIVIKGFTRHDISDRLRLSLDSDDYFKEDNPRARGNILHSIMSSVSVEDTVQAAVMSAVYSGDISAEEYFSVLEYINTAIGSVRDRGWFSGQYEIINEVAIISPGGDISRPDRVMAREDEAIVVDYKFGERQRKYEVQVKSYARLLEDMGYRKVKAYLWYVDNNEIQEIVI